MDIFLALAEGKRGAIARSNEVAAHILENPAHMPTLIGALSVTDTIVVSHAAHACLTVYKKSPDLLVPYKNTLLALLEGQNQWELIEQLSKIVPFLACTVEENAALTARLVSIVESGKSSIARTCALQALVDMAALDGIHRQMADKALAYALAHGTKAMQARARKLMIS